MFDNPTVRDIGQAQAATTSSADRKSLLDRCTDLAISGEVLSFLSCDLEKHGFAGSTHIPQILFLALITRAFTQPVSAVVKGPSSSGKSFALKAALRYVPKSAYEVFSGL